MCLQGKHHLENNHLEQWFPSHVSYIKGGLLTRWANGEDCEWSSQYHIGNMNT